MTLPSTAWIIGLGASAAGLLVLLLALRGPLLRWYYDREIRSLQNELLQALNTGRLNDAAALRELVLQSQAERDR